MMMSPFDLSTVTTPFFTFQPAASPLSLVHAERSFPSKSTMASLGAAQVRASPGVTISGCGVQYSDMPGRMASGFG